MFRRARALHRWTGLLSSLFLILIGATGFLLATKDVFGWIRPPEGTGTPLSSLRQAVSLDTAAQAAFALGIPELSEPRDIDRIDYRPRSNVYKITSREGYHEVQVDGATGRVVSRGFRRDQLTEDLHDLSYFDGALKRWVLPLVGVALVGLGVSGVYLVIEPILRRRRYLRRSRHGVETRQTK